MKKILVALAVAAAIGLSGWGTSQAEAAPFSFGISVGHGGHGHGHHGHGYGGPGYCGPSVGLYGIGTGHYHWHDTSHYHYHPGSAWRHGDHYHYTPGHLHLHRQGHWDYHPW